MIAPKATLVQDADRPDVVGGDVCMQRSGPQLGEERGQRSCGDALAPVLAADPVPDVALPVVLPAHDVARDGTLGQAKRLVASGDVIGGLAGMLQALTDDRDSARDAMITVFTAVGDEDPLVQEYRRLLSAALF